MINCWIIHVMYHKKYYCNQKSWISTPALRHKRRRRQIKRHPLIDRFGWLLANNVGPAEGGQRWNPPHTLRMHGVFRWCATAASSAQFHGTFISRYPSSRTYQRLPRTQGARRCYHLRRWFMNYGIDYLSWISTPASCQKLRAGQSWTIGNN